jgi:hypothetical protein
MITPLIIQNLIYIRYLIGVLYATTVLVVISKSSFLKILVLIGIYKILFRYYFAHVDIIKSIHR